MHVYERSVLDDERTSLSVIASHIEAGQSVLDLGMGSGALGHYLKARRAVVLDGATINPQEGELARPSYRSVVVIDLDTADLCAIFGEQRYDWIVCADVLEHLKYPDKVVRQCAQLLKPGGRLISSIPNIAYCGLLAELMLGDFRYRPEGLLDSTHLRFFTRASLQRWFHEHGWQIQTLATIERTLDASEFQAPFDALAPAVARSLLALPDALTYQFISICQPLGQGHVSAHTPTIQPGHARAVFSTQLFLGDLSGYAEDQKLVCAGTVGLDPQVLEFAIPARLQQPYTGLRLDPADRPGFMHLHRIELQGTTGHALWEWTAGPQSLSALRGAKHAGMAISPLWPSLHSVLLVLFNEDPHIELPVDANTLDTLSRQGGTLRVSAGWPMSSDFMAAAQPMRELDSAKQAALEQLATQHQLAAVQATRLAHAQAEQQQLLTTCNALQDEKQRTVELLRQTEFKAQQIQTQFGQLQQHLAWIEQSTVFRVTRPLVKLKMQMDRCLQRKPAPTATDPVTLHTHAPGDKTSAMVDVIVPVYKGLEDTSTCLEAVIRTQGRTPYRLVVINDCSPEPEVTRWLRDFAARHPAVVLLENEHNLGFVATVNRGMALSDAHDVVLLNSDAEVANNWLDRLQGAAYSGASVATATPFSNNATICSYPRFCHVNDMPLGCSVADMDRLCADTLAGLTVDIPTAHGFCMYIRRDCLTQVGLFDVDNFGKGYGEENDFCVRASNAGWTHRHALDVFVRHAGGVSFGATKSDRELQAMATLRRLHPQYEPSVHQFLQKDPARLGRLALDLARVACSTLPVVLNVTHNREGGTLRHQRELAQQLAGRALFLTLTPAHGGVALSLTGASEGLNLHFALPQQREQLLDTLRQLRVAHIHYHHLLGHGDEVLQLPKYLGVGHDFTAHDFYTYCPQISLTDHTDRYCGERGLAQCRACVHRNPAPQHLTIEAWRARHEPLLAQARHVLAPSQDAARRMHAYVPQAHIAVVPHPDLDTHALPTPAPQPLAANRPLKIVVIGALSRIKGADILEATAKLAADKAAPVEFHLLGYGYRHLRSQPKAKLTVHGAYEEQDLPQLLQWLQADLVWFPALWPETYSYTLSACLHAGLPVLAPDLGAFVDRLHNRPWSWVADWQQTPQQWLDLLLNIRNQHFATGLGPALVQPPIGSGVPGQELYAQWRYEADYLQGLPQRPALGHAKAFTLAEKLLALDFGAPTDVTSASRALRVLARLRATPGLSVLARHIPAHWQRRVKNWLSS